MAGKIPEIDLQEMQGEQLNKKLREACEKWGCFRVVNHGIPTDLMADIKSLVSDLFDRPANINQTHQSLSSFCSNLDEVSPQQRETMEMYAQALQKLSKDIANRMAESMGLIDYTFEGWSLQFQIKRHLCHTQLTKPSRGLSKRTDLSLLTVIQGDENLRGLEILDPSGLFVAVDPIPGTFFVMVGDFAVPWSNGKLRNVKYRITWMDTRIRKSISTLVLPGNDEVILAHQKFLSGDRPPKYAPFTYAELSELQASKKLYAGEAVQLMRWKNKYPKRYKPLIFRLWGMDFTALSQIQPSK